MIYKNVSGACVNIDCWPHLIIFNIICVKLFSENEKRN